MSSMLPMKDGAPDWERFIHERAQECWEQMSDMMAVTMSSIQLQGLPAAAVPNAYLAFFEAAMKHVGSIGAVMVTEGVWSMEDFQKAMLASMMEGYTQRRMDLEDEITANSPLIVGGKG